MQRSVGRNCADPYPSFRRCLGNDPDQCPQRECGQNDPHHLENQERPSNHLSHQRLKDKEHRRPPSNTGLRHGIQTRVRCGRANEAKDRGRHECRNQQRAQAPVTCVRPGDFGLLEFEPKSDRSVVPVITPLPKQSLHILLRRIVGVSDKFIPATFRTKKCDRGIAIGDSDDC